jgi:GTP:adenosylcobinamide-phosphate guanylyltransferase
MGGAMKPKVTSTQKEQTTGWTAVLLAGDRPGGDPLAAHFNVKSKALIPIGGVTMLRRVADTLLAVPRIERVVILAQDPAALLIGDAAGLATNPRVALAVGGAGIATSIAAIAGTAAAPWPVLVTTADHALLTPEMVGEFLAGAAGCDLALGVGERRIVEAGYPATRRTWLKFADGHYSGANLFALGSPKVADALAFWSGIEQQRKKVWKMVAPFGPWLFFRTMTRTISFDKALAQAAAKFGVSARPVILSAPEAVIDVDKVADYELVEAILAERR